MASVNSRNQDNTLEARLRTQPAVHGRSMECEARDILRSALSREPTRKGSMAAFIRARFASLAGAELPVVTRDPIRAPPSFDE